MTNPITAAFAATPHWMLDIRSYDGLEIQPCHIVGRADDGNEIVEPCEPEEAEFWTVYGHSREGGVNAFEDFPNAEKARAFAERLLACYPHLQEQGLLDLAG